MTGFVAKLQIRCTHLYVYNISLYKLFHQHIQTNLNNFQFVFIHTSLYRAQLLKNIKLNKHFDHIYQIFNFKN